MYGTTEYFLNKNEKKNENQKRYEGRFKRVYDSNAIAHIHRVHQNSHFSQSVGTQEKLCTMEALIDANMWLQNGLYNSSN